MIDIVLLVAYALFLWWFSTGLVLYLIRLAPHTFRTSLIVASALALLALVGLAWSSTCETTFAAYLSFTCGLMVYAWQELSYYTGFLTGPRKVRCEKGCHGWRHFGHAIGSNLYHELATLLGAGVVLWVCRDAPNQVGMWTYMVLWGMQLSAKLNVFLGVRNLSEEFLPNHMQHLKGFLNKRSMNLLFPFSIVIGTVLTVWLVQLALAAGADSFAVAGWSLLASLMALGVLEHWLLILPLSATALWQWWLALQESIPAPGSQSQHSRRRPELSSMTALSLSNSPLSSSSAIAASSNEVISKRTCLMHGREN
ncbi:MAG: putative photosynthetic complex assembly protein PuhE [Gammaproteobacteria bacterium]|nr:putative photosynthetic complex assembly protein PuhE [Gammaproteobacteria bacterium]MCY4358363.1 putative photosynthetic complex assembly protein PuhE [Gammaproteobacteria bacterium]